ncbi:MAG: hypothetical protein NTY74_14210 [Ignavibacteriae bacterium]|nr:hypothetical protein [Ignavibacteriota bacterium]
MDLELIFDDFTKTVFYDKSSIIDDGDSITVMIVTNHNTPVKLKGEKGKYYKTSMKRVKYYCGKSQEIVYEWFVGLTDGSVRVLINRDIETYYVKEETSSTVYRYFCELCKGCYRQK